MSNRFPALLAVAALALGVGSASAATVRTHVPVPAAPALQQDEAAPSQAASAGPYNCGRAELHSRLERRVCGG